MIHRLFIVFLLVFSSVLFAQFENVSVQLDLKQIRENDKYIINTFADEVQNYILTSPFAPGAEDLGININIHFVFESIEDNSNNHIVNAQVLITNSLDLNYFTKGVEFPFSNGQSMFYSITFDPIASFLDYYAYIFIANELDTYDYLGGEQYFSLAEEIASEGKSSTYSRSWDDRWKKVRKIRRNQHLRSAKYHYFTALDNYTSENMNMENFQASIDEFYISLQDIDNDYGQDRFTIYFLKAYTSEVCELVSFINRKEIFHFLINFDEENKSIYQKYLK